MTPEFTSSRKKTIRVKINRNKNRHGMDSLRNTESLTFVLSSDLRETKNLRNSNNKKKRYGLSKISPLM